LLPNKRIFFYFYHTGKRFVDDRCDIEARSLSYITLLTIVPFLLLVLQSLKFLRVYPSLKILLFKTIETYFLPDKTELIIRYIDSALIRPGSIGFIGVILTILATLYLVFLLIRGVNRLWSKRIKVTFLHYLYKYMIIIIIIPCMLLISFYLQNLRFIQHYAVSFFKPLQKIETSSRIAGFFLNWLIVAFIYYVIPHGSVRFIYSLASGAISGSILYLTRIAINKYVALMPQMNLIYGSLTFLPLFLIWIYSSWLIILFGLELNNTFHFGPG